MEFDYYSPSFKIAFNVVIWFLVSSIRSWSYILARLSSFWFHWLQNRGLLIYTCILCIPFYTHVNPCVLLHKSAYSLFSIVLAVPKLIRELGRVSNFNLSINWHHHIRDHIEIGHLSFAPSIWKTMRWKLLCLLILKSITEIIKKV